MQRKRKMFRVGCEPWVVQTCIRLLCHLSHHNLPFRKRNFQQVDFGNQNLFQTKKEPFLRKNVRKSNFFKLHLKLNLSWFFSGLILWNLACCENQKMIYLLNHFIVLVFRKRIPGWEMFPLVDSNSSVVFQLWISTELNYFHLHVPTQLGQINW